MQSGPPVDDEVISQVQEFRKEFINSTLDEAKTDAAEEAWVT